jgi:hypothetical protein
MTQLEDSKVYMKTIKFSWIEPIMMGKIKPEEESEFLVKLIKKAACDESGNSIDDLDLDDFFKAQAFITNKMNPEKKS